MRGDATRHISKMTKMHPPCLTANIYTPPSNLLNLPVQIFTAVTNSKFR